eukprot:Seg1053.2 transcript_id=Seg1053.2/GoldUCD/mRNA.D3Y31 product="Zinc finger protein 333" protein_id=Seg1053.2/GoldUCD/D3Y31
MPRSFLVRNYFRRKYYWLIDESYEEDEETKEGDSANQNELNSGNFDFYEQRDENEWTYEDEKSFWFELGGSKEQFVGNIKEEFKDSSHTRIQNNRTDNDSTTQYKVSVDTAAGDLSSDTFALQNLEEKLSQMLQENPEIVKKNIRQFLDNNRIPLKEIAVETGIAEESITQYMDGSEQFIKVQREEFYRWYLYKILRPPNGQDDKSFTCYKCGKIFAYESYLERHIKYVCPDNTGRTWKCSYCGKAFQYPCYLKRHIRSHTGESPYKCDQCDRAFVRSTDLQRHIRNHTGEKPYKCSECDRAFARSTDLKRHMRTHTGEKPYKCWQCGKTFSQSGSLQTHLHTHNKDGSGGRKHAKGSK